MNVGGYSWYRPDFPEYNAAQREVIPFCDQDFNLVVCFGTAVGKTVIAECCFGYHLGSGEGRVAYISPYRTLCVEKHEKWREDVFLSPRGVAIRTGEKRSGEVLQSSAGLTVMTSEAFDVRTRKRAKWGEWFDSLECVVVDEAHMLGDKDRGVAMEAALMRLSAINPKCRLVLLSATMDNALDVAKWVKSLNNKPTKCITSDWRPNEVAIREIVGTGWSDMIEQLIDEARVASGKTLVFVHSKRVGTDLVRRLRKAGVKTAFHNASVSKGRRGKIEKMFDDPSSGLDILVSTSTLGAGVNIG